MDMKSIQPMIRTNVALVVRSTRLERILNMEPVLQIDSCMSDKVNRTLRSVSGGGATESLREQEHEKAVWFIRSSQSLETQQLLAIRSPKCVSDSK